MLTDVDEAPLNEAVQAIHAAAGKAQSLAGDLTPASLDAVQFVYESPRIKPSPEFAAYAAASFPPGRPLAEAPEAPPRALAQAERAILDTLEHHANLRLRPVAAR